MQTIVSGGALRFPFRFSGAAASSQDDFAFLVRRFTPRTVFMHIGAAIGGEVSRLALEAASYVERVYAVDASGGLLQNLLGPCNLRLVRGDAARLGVPQASVDVAWSGAFMDALGAADAREHLDAVRRSLAPGGKYFFCGRAPSPEMFLEAGFWKLRCYYGALPLSLRLAPYASPDRLRFAALT
jgi:hypothetical protein